MFRQYYAQRCRGGDNPLRVGTIPVGAIFYIQDDGARRGIKRPVCRNPWMVMAYLNGTLGAARRDPKSGLWTSIYIAGRSDQAVVRSLRDGRTQTIAVHILQSHEDQDLRADNGPHRPSLPDQNTWLKIRSRRKTNQGSACPSSNAVVTPSSAKKASASKQTVRRYVCRASTMAA